MDIDTAYKAELSELKDEIIRSPEIGQEIGEQAYGAFKLWMRLAGYLRDDENETIATMRLLADGVSRFGYAKQAKARNLPHVVF